MALALASCDFPPTFGPDYFLTDKNWIEHIPLAAPPAADDDGSIVALDSSARWDWSWRGKTDNSYPYMTLVPYGTTPAATDGEHSLALDTPAWRLELANLFINGTFETPPDPAAYANSPNSAFSQGTAIHSKSLYIDLGDDSDDYVAWKMGELLDDVTATWSGGTYQLRMVVDPVSGLKYRHSLITEIDSPESGQATQPVLPDEHGSLFLTERFTGFKEGADSVDFAVTNGPFTMSIDEVRAVRTDMEPSLRLLLAPWDTDPSPSYDSTTDEDTRLTPGQYEFSVWLRIADEDLLFDDPARATQPTATYAARYVTLRMRQVVYEEGALNPTIGVSNEVAVDTVWRRYAVRMEDPSNLDYFDDMTLHPVMELSIAPTLTASVDAGAVLVAAPELNFYKDGF